MSDRSSKIGGAGSSDGPDPFDSGEVSGDTTEAEVERFFEELAQRIPRGLLERVKRTGDELARDPSRTKLDEYKKSVRELLDKALKKAAKVRSEVGLDSGGKLFATVTKVDQRLMELTEEILEGERELVKVARLVEEVKGLLVDTVS